VVPPAGTCIARFTPCGRYLVTFDAMRNEVVLYTFNGISTSLQGTESETVPAWHRSDHAIKFEDVLREHIRCRVATVPDEQLFAFCLVVHLEYLILATSKTGGTYGRDVDGYVDVSEEFVAPDVVTFYTVKISDGQVADKACLAVYGLDLSHHSASTLYEDILAVLSPMQQTIFVLQVLPTGKLEPKYVLGASCQDGDLEISREQHRLEVMAATAAAEDIHRNRSRTDGAATRPSVHHTNTLGASGSNLERGQHGGTTPFLEGIKQRMLAHLYLAAREESQAAEAFFPPHQAGEPPPPVRLSAYGMCGGRQALRNFYYFFKFYCDLKMHRVQLLDRERLLISWLSPTYSFEEGTAYRTAFTRGLQTVYHMPSTRVERVFEGGTDG